MKPDIEEWGLRRPNAVTLIIGSPGSGKTVLAYRIADELRGDRKVYCSMSRRFGRPKYYERLGWPITDDSVIMYNDAAITFHARKWREDENINVFMLQQIRRHKNVDWIWDVQNAGSLDLEVLRAADCIILKEPSLMQDRFERPEVVDMYEEANAAVSWDVTNAYVYTHKRNFVLTDIKKPSYWNESISTDDMFQPVPIWRRII